MNRSKKVRAAFGDESKSMSGKQAAVNTNEKEPLAIWRSGRKDGLVAINPKCLNWLSYRGGCINVCVGRGIVWVEVRSVCSAIELGYDEQLARLLKDKRYVKGVRVNALSALENIFLSPEAVTAWLYTIDENEVPRTKQDVLLRYQRGLARQVNEFAGQKTEIALKDQRINTLGKLGGVAFRLDRVVDEANRLLRQLPADKTGSTGCISHGHREAI